MARIVLRQTVPPNQQPVWTTIPPQTLVVGTPFTLDLNSFCSDPDGDTLVYNLILTGTSFLPSGLDLFVATGLLSGTPTVAGETPTMQIRAFDLRGGTADIFVPVSTIAADTTAPPVPTGLLANAVSSSQINISWNASVDVAGGPGQQVSGTQDYRLYRSTDGTNFSLRTTTTGTSFSDTGLTAGTTYHYRIAARDVALNESVQSSSVNATTTGASGTIVASMIPHRSTGVAPLGVHFDGSGTTSALVTYPFHDLTYFYDYGDPGSGNFWTGNSRNTKMGPAIGAHVYKTPGTYTATMFARLGVPWPQQKYIPAGKIVWVNNNTYQCSTAHTSGTTFSTTNWTLHTSGYVDSAVASQTITVTNPDTVYSAANTYIVATDGNFTGAPAGVQVTSLSAIPDYNGKRIRLKRGIASSVGAINLGNSTSSGTLAHKDDDVLVDTWGSGSKPVVTAVSLTNGGNVLIAANWSERCMFRDLNIQQSLTGFIHRHIVVADCDLTNTSNMPQYRLNMGTSLSQIYNAGGNAANQIYAPYGIFYADCDVAGVPNSTGNPHIQVVGCYENSAILGCRFRGGQREHTFRCWASYKLLVSDCEFEGRAQATDNNRHPVKHQAGGNVEYDPNKIIAQYLAESGRHWKTQYFSLVDCVVGHAQNQGQWCLAYASQNDSSGSVEFTDDGTLWRVEFVTGTSANILDVFTLGKRISLHGCTRDGNQGAVRMNPQHFGERNDQTAPASQHGPYLHDISNPAIN